MGDFQSKRPFAFVIAFTMPAGIRSAGRGTKTLENLLFNGKGFFTKRNRGTTSSIFGKKPAIGVYPAGR